MSATVPTKVEFDALTAKVAAVSAAQVATAAELVTAEQRITTLEAVPVPPPVVAPPVITNPLTVPDLTVIATTDTTLSIRFTEVSDGAGLPASYEIRSTPGVMAWGAAPPAGELTGSVVGAPRVFVLTNLTPGTNYQVQLMAYRGTLNVDAVFGDLSNVASGTTGLVAVPPPPSVGEPILGAAIPILADNFDAYTAPQSYVESDKWWPWLVPSEPLSAYGVVPGRVGKAIQLTYTVGNPERHLWITHPEVKPGGWYSPASAAIAVSYGFRIHKNGSPGGSPGYGSTNKGMKWFELWRQDQSDRGQFGPTAGNAQTGPLWHFHPAGSTVLAGFQPVGPYWNQLNDAQWHRVTYLVKPSTVRGDLTGIARMWIDGQKIVDVSAPAIGVTPAGGTKVWCTDAEVRSLDTMPIGRLHLGEYMNGVLGDGVTDLPMSLEFEDFAWWMVPSQSPPPPTSTAWPNAPAAWQTVLDTDLNVIPTPAGGRITCS